MRSVMAILVFLAATALVVFSQAQDGPADEQTVLETIQN